ncbi:hypothetical protein EVAR_77610_1 [Eumeta japonica]|uniref:Uncharacterized protein n=1 Tax=Eumeta variegata TaxID=151549 RepID=A0A4C1T6U1_EUMVA|nr:hypothetical protein EVAR_77610_1 [Eumeta japonica]
MSTALHKIANTPLKLLIDAGANRSFTTPTLSNYYARHLGDTAVRGDWRARHDPERLRLRPRFAEFNDDSELTFSIYKFHNYFDSFIGLDLLNKWDSNIDLKTKILITKNAAAPLNCFVKLQNSELLIRITISKTRRNNNGFTDPGRNFISKTEGCYKNVWTGRVEGIAPQPHGAGRPLVAHASADAVVSLVIS